MQVKKQLRKKYKPDDLSKFVDLQVESDVSNVEVAVQSITAGWDWKPQVLYLYMYMFYLVKVIYLHIDDMQDSKAEKVEDENMQLFNMTTLVVFPSQPSHNDLCLTLSVSVDGTETQTVTVERKASKKCVCQVFYHREGLNYWKTMIAFLPADLLEVS